MRKCLYITGGIVILILGILGLLVSSSRSKEKLSVEHQPIGGFDRTITVVADIDYDPYSCLDENGQISGHDIELIYAMANRMQVNVEVQLLPWSDCKQAVLEGNADLITGLDFRPDDNPGFEFSYALLNDPFVCFGRKDFQNIEQLRKKRIATIKQSGSFTEFLIPYHLEENTRSYATYTEAMQSVISGDNDYAIARYSVGRRILAKLGDDTLHVVGPPLANNSVCIGMKKGNTELLAEVNEALSRLATDGTIQELSNKWLEKYVEFISWRDVLYHYRHPILFTLAALVLLISAIILYSYRVKARSFENTQRALEYQQLLIDATQGLYENIYELDITHNRAASESTRRYFERLGMSGDTSFDEALREIARQQIKEDFIQGYLNTFSTQKIIEAYQKGMTSLSYDLMISENGFHYYWMRISARIFFWHTDQTVRMIVFRKNIDDQKRMEEQLVEKAQKDSMTGLYNKETTERLAGDFLSQSGASSQTHALLIIDVDQFKQVNDTYGHAFGDRILKRFADVLQSQFRATDIVGRIGGDEFLVLIKSISGDQWLQGKLRSLVQDLHKEEELDGNRCKVSASIGAALFPQTAATYEELFQQADTALYQVKNNGRNGFQILSGTE